MNHGQSKTIFISLLILAALIGFAFEVLGWSLFAASVIWIGLQTREFSKVQNWTEKPLTPPTNGFGGWFELAYEPYRLIQKERARTKAISLRLRQVYDLAEVIPDAVIILGPSNEIESLNNAAKKLLRLKDSDIGLGISTIVRNPDFVMFMNAPSFLDPLEFSSPFDQSQIFEARRFDVGVEQKVILVRDITALNRLLTMRQSFVANVSHELRTPLTVVNGYLETMSDPEQPEKLRLSLIDKLNSPMMRMRSLVDDLLLLTQLESSPSVATKLPISVPSLLQNACQELQGLESSPGQIVIRCESEMSINGHAKELHSVCVNLLTNAIKYSPAGSPIEISWSDIDDGARLQVKDEGYGIAEEHLHRLTERFYRVDMSDSRTRGGTGLGLAIVKHILRRHGSSLNIESNANQGSTFYCDFKPSQIEADASSSR
jgi:two-component system phosphate regulon sensor histidine kinase PhoR